jgi:hypothetical protein
VVRLVVAAVVQGEAAILQAGPEIDDEREVEGQWVQP